MLFEVEDQISGGSGEGEGDGVLSEQLGIILRHPESVDKGRVIFSPQNRVVSLPPLNPLERFLEVTADIG